jgi:hypothetical protein
MAMNPAHINATATRVGLVPVDVGKSKEDEPAPHATDARAPKTPARRGRCLVFILSIQQKERDVLTRRHRDAQQMKVSQPKRGGARESGREWRGGRASVRDGTAIHERAIRVRTNSTNASAMPTHAMTSAALKGHSPSSADMVS